MFFFFFFLVFGACSFLEVGGFSFLFFFCFSRNGEFVVFVVGR